MLFRLSEDYDFKGSLLFWERKLSHAGVRLGEDELSYATLCALKPCFKICDLFARELKHTNTHNTQHFLSSSPKVKGTNCELGIGKSIKWK